MKLLFVYDMPQEHALLWRDGLWAALKQLEKDFEITYNNLSQVEILPYRYKDYDFVLGWGGTNSKVAQLELDGLCFGGGDFTDSSLDRFKVVFVENEMQLVKPHFRHAFGTNTDLFTYREQPKIIDALYPAAFAQWKHQEIFAEICQKENLKGLAVGYIQRDNMEESGALIYECVTRGVAVMDWIPSESLALLYNASKEVIITADPSGGCERAILEAKASGVPVRVVSESKKLHILNNLTEKEVQEKWSHLNYAQALKEGILNVWKPQ